MACAWMGPGEREEWPVSVEAGSVSVLAMSLVDVRWGRRAWTWAVGVGN